MTKAADLALGKIVALKTALIEFTDGDDAIAVADAGVVTLLTTAVAKSEGGAVTTNIAQGLGKMFCAFNGTGTIAILDSFNASGITDRAAGKYTITIANDMANAAFVQSGNAKKTDGTEDPNQTVVFGAGTGYTKLASEVHMVTGRGAAMYDTASAEIVIHGDLA